MQMSARPRVPDAQLTKPAGGPCVLVNRRAAKQRRRRHLIPRDGRAFVSETDGNI
jgi:hypothetical protein